MSWKKITPEDKKQYISVNEETGEIYIVRKQSPFLPLVKREYTTVYKVKQMIFDELPIEEWLLNAFLEWEKEFKSVNQLQLQQFTRGK